MGVPEQSQTQTRGANVVQGKYEHLACEHLVVMSILPHQKKNGTRVGNWRGFRTRTQTARGHSGNLLFVEIIVRQPGVEKLLQAQTPRNLFSPFFKGND